MVLATPLRMEFTIHFETEPHGRKKIRQGKRPESVGRIPRVARLLALAHHFDDLIQQGIVADYAEIARLSQLSRARITQISYLRFLAPDIQAQIAELPRSYKKDMIAEKALRQIAQIPEWEVQRQRFAVYTHTA